VDIFPKGNTMSRPMADRPKWRARRQFTVKGVNVERWRQASADMRQVRQAGA
jgi:hypothetical protein